MNKYEADKQVAPQRVLLPEAVLPYCFNTAAVLAIPENIPAAGPTNFGEYWGAYGMSCRGNEFNTAKNKQKTEEIIKRHKESGEPLRLVTIVCPPYEMEVLCSRNNKGLFSDINDDPLSHNFMYSYKLLAFCLAQTADFIESQGVKTQMTWVIGDWALRDSRKDEQRYDANPVRTISTLDSFAASTQAYFDDYFGKGRIEVERFMNTEITDIYPMTMPQTAQQKKEWVMENIAYIQNLLEQSDNSKDFAQALPMIIDLYNSMGAKIVELADPSKWASLELEKKNLKKVAIKFFQVLKNTIASRK